jgi:cytoskeletal protein RodZ
VVLRPVGDLPPSVYWVRRLVVLAVLVLVVLVVWWLWPGGGDNTSPTGSDQPTSLPTASPTPTPTPTPSPTESRTKQSSTPTDEPLCPDSAIEVTVRTNAKSYPANALPDITLSVTNVSDESCSRDVGQASNELQITSGGAQVWSSDDCSPGGGADFQTLAPGDSWAQTVTWPKVQSSEGCPSPAESVSAGTYQVLARNGELLSEPVAFTLQ